MQKRGLLRKSAAISCWVLISARRAPGEAVIGQLGDPLPPMTPVMATGQGVKAAKKRRNLFKTTRSTNRSDEGKRSAIQFGDINR